MIFCSMQGCFAMEASLASKDLNDIDFTELNFLGQKARIEELMMPLCAPLKTAYSHQFLREFESEVKGADIKVFSEFVSQSPFLNDLKTRFKKENLKTVCELGYAFLALGIKREKDLNAFVRPGRESLVRFSVTLTPMEGCAKRHMLDPDTKIQVMDMSTAAVSVCSIEELTPQAFFDLAFNLYFNTLWRLFENKALGKNILFPKGERKQFHCPSKKKNVSDSQYMNTLIHAISKEKSALASKKNEALKRFGRRYGLEKYYGGFPFFQSYPQAFEVIMERSALSFFYQVEQDQTPSFDGLGNFFLIRENFLKLPLEQKKDYFIFLCAEEFVIKWLIENSERITQSSCEEPGENLNPICVKEYIVDPKKASEVTILKSFLEPSPIVQEETRSIDEIVRQIEGKVSREGKQKKKKKKKGNSQKSQSTQDGKSHQDSVNQEGTERKQGRKRHRKKKPSHRPHQGITLLDCPQQSEKVKDKKKESSDKEESQNTKKEGDSQTKKGLFGNLQKGVKALVKTGEVMAQHYLNPQSPPSYTQVASAYLKYMPQALGIVKNLKNCAEEAAQEENEAIRKYRAIKVEQEKIASQIVSGNKDESLLVDEKGEEEKIGKEEEILNQTKDRMGFIQEEFQKLSKIKEDASRSLPKTDREAQGVMTLYHCGDHYLKNTERSLARKKYAENKIEKARNHRTEQILQMAQEIRENKNN